MLLLNFLNCLRARVRQQGQARRGQAAVEYILLVALGLFLMIIAFTVALYINNFTLYAGGNIEEIRKGVIGLIAQ